MALQLSKSELVKGYHKAQSLAKANTRIKEKSKEAIDTAVRTVEVTGAAFLGGAIQGYTYDPAKGTAGVELAGIPLDLGLGIAGHIAGFAFMDAETAKHAHAFSDGFLACSAATYGRSAGKKMKEKMVAPGGLLGK